MRSADPSSRVLFAALSVLCVGVAQSRAAPPGDDAAIWQLAEQRAVVYEDCARNAARLLQGWVTEKQDPTTFLFSRGGKWNYQNEAADHYSSLVIIAHYVKPDLIQPGGPLSKTMDSCRDLCQLENGLLAEYDLRKMEKGPDASLDHLSEWLRDGFIRIAENMGTENRWFDEFVRLTDAMLDEADRRGGIAKTFTEGEFIGHMLQSLSRLYMMTGNERYLLAAEELADAQLADPDKVIGMATLWDHSCEMTPGLGEFLAMEGQLQRPKLKQYSEAMRQVLDRLLADHAHPETGLLCEKTIGADGTVRWKRPPNAWGYVLFTYENYDRATGEGRYTESVVKPLKWLEQNYRNYDSVKNLWIYNRSSDAHSDSYESMMSLINRYPEQAELQHGLYGLLDWMTLQHIHRRQPDKKYGPYTGGHFDGSTGRNLCIHMMLNSRNVRATPFSEGLQLGGAQTDDGALYLHFKNASKEPWTGKLRFEKSRVEYVGGRIDWARINETAQWYCVDPEAKYSVVCDDLQPVTMTGAQLCDGLPLGAKPSESHRIVVRKCVEGQ